MYLIVQKIPSSNRWMMTQKWNISQFSIGQFLYNCFCYNHHFISGHNFCLNISLLKDHLQWPEIQHSSTQRRGDYHIPGGQYVQPLWGTLFILLFSQWVHIMKTGFTLGSNFDFLFSHWGPNLGKGTCFFLQFLPIYFLGRMRFTQVLLKSNNIFVLKMSLESIDQEKCLPKIKNASILAIFSLLFSPWVQLFVI